MAREPVEPIEKVLIKRKIPDFEKPEEGERGVPLVIPLWVPFSPERFLELLPKSVGRVNECVNENLRKERQKHAEIHRENETSREIKIAAQRHHMRRIPQERVKFVWTQGAPERYK